MRTRTDYSEATSKERVSHQPTGSKIQLSEWNYQNALTTCSWDAPTCFLEMQLAEFDHPNSHPRKLANRISVISPRLGALIVFASLGPRLFANRSVQSLQTFRRKSLQCQTQCNWPSYRNWISSPFHHMRLWFCFSESACEINTRFQLPPLGSIGRWPLCGQCVEWSAIRKLRPSVCFSNTHRLPGPIYPTCNRIIHLWTYNFIITTRIFKFEPFMNK